MQIVEYKKILLNGSLVNPEWIIEGDMLYNPIDKTYVGLVLHENKREYYIPDSVRYLTVQESIDRSLQIHTQIPYKKAHILEEPPYNIEEVEIFVQEYLDAMLSKFEDNL